MFLRTQIGNARRQVLSGLARLDVVIPSDRPLISFSFDDFPQTALTVGGAILQEAGVRGTYYAAPGLMDTQNHLGPHFRLEDLMDLLAAGHELASHTYSHVSARATRFESYVDEVEKGFDALRKLGFDASRHFSYPFGEITLRVKRAVGSKMQSCRSIMAGLNGPRNDLNLLRANHLYGDSSEFPQVQSLIDENGRKGSWLIFYTHDVRPTPSRYGCTPEFLQKVVRAAVASGARVATVGEVVALVRPLESASPESLQVRQA
jgi:peptidoglycan/xylan/chitin deacetylase (PgdA/CDA1 family)